ncbi:hypothetical protein [Agromyces humatus]|nr:hypothetical protein [Agromyces humatus]
MSPETDELATEPPATQSSWIARTPLWARIVVPAVVLVGGAAVVVSAMAAEAQPPATVESMCRSAVEAKLETRGHSDVDVSRSFQIAEADGAQRVSGTVSSVDDSGHVDHAQVRCVVRVDGDTIRVVSARLSD